MNISYQTLSLITLAFVAVVLLIRCTGTKNQPSTLEETDAVSESRDYKFYFNTQPCHGFCPVVKMYFDSEGNAYFDGIRNFDRVGPHVLPKASERIEDIFRTIESYHWDSFEEDYPNVVVDLPTWNFVFVSDSNFYKIRGYNNLPDSLSAFGKKLLELGKGPHWERYNEPIPQFDPADYLDNQLILHLSNKADIEDFQKPYKRYEFKLIRRLSPDMFDYWLCDFSEERISRENLIEILKKDPDVISVQPNRKASLRDGGR